MTKQEEIDWGKFFRGLSKVGDDDPNPATMRRLLEADDRLLGYGVVKAKAETKTKPAVKAEAETKTKPAVKAKERGIMATLKHWWKK